MSILEAIHPSVERDVVDGLDAVTLAAGALEATFVPGLGMVGASLRHAGEELLDRRAGPRAYRDTGAVMGVPLLHPWANRLARDELIVAGRRVRLPGPPTVWRDEHGLPIHGLVGAHPGWSVHEADADGHAARLVALLDFAADPAAVPISFGDHPPLKFPRADRADWRVQMPPRRHLELDELGIPTGGGHWNSAADFRLGELSFHDGYDGIEDGAVFSVGGSGREIRVSSDAGFPAAQVFSPPGATGVNSSRNAWRGASTSEHEHPHCAPCRPRRRSIRRLHADCRLRAVGRLQLVCPRGSGRLDRLAVPPSL